MSETLHFFQQMAIPEESWSEEDWTSKTPQDASGVHHFFPGGVGSHAVILAPNERVILRKNANGMYVYVVTP